jgi:hypothetical protein
LTPHGISPMPRSTQTWVFQLFKKSSTTEVPSTEHDYNPTRTRYFNPFHGILSYADWNDSGQLTYNMVHEISSLEGTSSRQAVYRLDSSQHISLWNTLYSDCWFDTRKKIHSLYMHTILYTKTYLPFQAIYLEGFKPWKCEEYIFPKQRYSNYDLRYVTFQKTTPLC